MQNSQQVELVEKNLKPDLKTVNLQKVNLKKEKYTELATALHAMSLAKNIKLMEGTLTVWDKLIAEDIINGFFDFSDFIEAIKQGIRMPMYNRIDYADVYRIAVERFSQRKKAYDIKKTVVKRREDQKITGEPVTPSLIQIMKNKLKGDD